MLAELEIILDMIRAMYYNVKHENSYTHNPIGRRPKQVAG